MTSDENFKIIKRIEQENAKKEADQKEKENIKKEAVMKHRKVKAAMKRKQIKNVSKKIKLILNFNLCCLKRCTSGLPDRLR